MALSFSGKLSIASNVVALAAVGAAWHGWPSVAPLPYAVHKVLHVMGVIVFMGNLIAGPLWLWFSAYQDDGKHYAFAARMLDEADVWLTTPGVQLTVWNGICLAAALGGVQKHAWLVESMVWLVVSSLISVGLLIPMQHRLVAAAQAGEVSRARAALIQWSIWGTVVMVPFTAVGWLMVAKTPIFLG